MELIQQINDKIEELNKTIKEEKTLADIRSLQVKECRSKFGVDSKEYQEMFLLANKEFMKRMKKIEHREQLEKDLQVLRFINGEKALYNDLMLELLKEYKIKVAPRTLNWIKNSLQVGGVENYSYIGNQSKAYFKVAEQLQEALKNNYKVSL